MNLRNTQFRISSALAIVMTITAFGLSQMPHPAAAITAVNAQVGVAAAKVTATGQMFAFKLNNRAQTAQLRVGEAVYPNFTTDQISLEGRTVAGTIIAMGGSPGPNGVPLIEGIRNNLQRVTLAADPADPNRRTAIVSLKLNQPKGGKSPAFICAGVNGHGLELQDQARNGSFTGRVKLAEPFPTREGLLFNMKGGDLNPEKASVTVTVTAHVVPCPANCNGFLGQLLGFKDPCVICFEITTVKITGTVSSD